MQKLRDGMDLPVIATAFFLVFLGTGAAQPFIVGYVHDERGYPPAQAAMVLSTVYFTFVVFRFFMGSIIARSGLHPAKIVGISAYAIFPVVLYFAPSFAWIIVGSVMWGIGAPLMWTSSMVQVMNTSSANRYGRSTGMLQGAVMVALFIGSYLLGYLYEHHDYKAVFMVSAALGVVGVLVMAVSPNRVLPPSNSAVRQIRGVFSDWETRAMMALLLFGGLAYGVMLNGIKPHIESVAGEVWLKRLLPFFPLSAILANYATGPISDRIGRWPIITMGFALGSLGLALAWMGWHPAILASALMLIGIQHSIIPLAGFAWVADRYEPAERAAMVGYVFCFRDLGVALAIQMGGFISDPRLAFGGFGALLALCAILAFCVQLAVAAKEKSGPVK